MSEAGGSSDSVERSIGGLSSKDLALCLDRAVAVEMLLEGLAGVAATEEARPTLIAAARAISHFLPFVVAVGAPDNVVRSLEALAGALHDLTEGRPASFLARQEKFDGYAPATNDVKWRQAAAAYMIYRKSAARLPNKEAAARDLHLALKAHGALVEETQLRSIYGDAKSIRKQPRFKVAAAPTTDAEAANLVRYLALNRAFLETKTRRQR